MDSAFHSNITSKRRRIERKANESSPSLRKSPISPKKPKQITKSAQIHIQSFDVPLISPVTGLSLSSITLEPDRPYAIGRTGDFLFKNCFVSNQHCQILFDSYKRKIYVLDGVLLLKSIHSSNHDCIVSEFRRRLIDCSNNNNILESGEFKGSYFSGIRVSLNGVYVNGVRMTRGMVRELCTGDEVFLACGSEGNCSLGVQIGFLINGVVFMEEVVTGSNEVHLDREPLFESTGLLECSQGSVSSGKRSKRVYAIRGNEIMVPDFDFQNKKLGGVVERAKFLLGQCRDVLGSDDPISYIRQCDSFDIGLGSACTWNKKSNRFLFGTLCDNSKFVVQDDEELNAGELVVMHELQQRDNLQNDHGIQIDREKSDRNHVCVGGDNLQEKDIGGVCSESCDNFKNSSLNSVLKENAPCFRGVAQMKAQENCCPPPGKKFYLNRLQFMDCDSFSHPVVISLPELLYPVESILRIFIATFTSDILWFLSYCEIPCHLPVTIACHNTERCWSSSPDNRTYVPYSGFPNLVVVFPPFPEAIAFGQDRKRQGIACHHPKLLVLQREDSIRIIITSANLVSNQWNNVTNTIWWQDFPVRSAPDLSSLFIRVSDGETNKNSRSDFAAHLAGFMASLLIDVPSQAYWITELAKYNFDGAAGHLVASVPGIHSCRSPNAYRLPLEPYNDQFLGSVEASVVGLSHLFDTAADRNGARLKQLAGFLGKYCENAHGTSEIILRRNLNVPVDVNAVSILVPNPNQFSEGDCIQLGFLPRHVAKWVSPLWDSGFFRFSGYVYRKEALAAALGGSSMRVQLILHVAQGPCFPDMMRMMQPEHVVSFCPLMASIQRCTGLWRLEEVLGLYKWPDSQQSDFIYGSSSIGSINAQFLAAFSAAAGKRSLQLVDSEESDPEWGRWSASQELRNPSIRIVFPTIESVKNACNGILPSRRILSFSEKTWQRLRILDILHDAVPQPCDRLGQPMHVKVARRRFQSKTDASSYGWIYCGSHNFSAAAWGRPISNPFSRLHVCNYELGIIFTFPPTETKGIINEGCGNLDDIVMPFVVPAPKYGPADRPATARAMREALTELKEQGIEEAITEETTEDIPDEEEDVVGATDFVVEEKEEEKAYAEMLWNQVDSS